MPSLTDRLRAYFLAHPNQWIPQRTIADIAGLGGYRTRASELRHAPYSMTIETRVELIDGDTRAKRSLYRYKPAAQREGVA